MPGTPILYYGDEIGMGDNIYLGDRNGVRTPMQWTPRPQRRLLSAPMPQRALLCRSIMDPVYGYQAVNVEAQERIPGSLLTGSRAHRSPCAGATRSFGRGTLEFLHPENRTRARLPARARGRTMLCVANLSRFASTSSWISRASGDRVPVEIFGPGPFPPIGELPYLLTLARHGFYWFELTDGADGAE